MKAVFFSYTLPGACIIMSAVFLAEGGGGSGGGGSLSRH